MDLMRKISETNAVSGSEMYFMRKIAPEALEKYRMPDGRFIDSIGNVMLFKEGRRHDKKRAVLTHTDEAGFIITEVTDKGFLKFEAVGKIDPRVIISKKVSVGESRVAGVIGMKAIHLQKKSEREAVAEVKSLYIDIGAKSRRDALKRVKLGDYAAFDTSFSRLSDKVIKGKALDRMGVYCVLKAMEEDIEYDTYFIFAAQRHTGSRGASVALENIDADEVLTIDAVEAADMYGTKPEDGRAPLRGGVIIGGADKLGISDTELSERLFETAEENGVKAARAPSYESGSVGAVRSAYGGKRAAMAAIPCRYIRTPASLMSTEDIESMTELIKAFLKSR